MVQNNSALNTCIAWPNMISNTAGRPGACVKTDASVCILAGPAAHHPMYSCFHRHSNHWWVPGFQSFDSTRKRTAATKSSLNHDSSEKTSIKEFPKNVNLDMFLLRGRKFCNLILLPLKPVLECKLIARVATHDNASNSKSGEARVCVCVYACTIWENQLWLPKQFSTTLGKKFGTATC